jgi:hypothetical protein
MGRAEVLRELMEGTVAHELALADGLEAAERERAGTWEEWSARDALAHSAAWKASVADELARAARGEPSRRGDDHDYEVENKRIYDEHAGKDWAEITALVREAHEALVGELERLSQADLERQDLVPWQEERPVWRLFAGNGVIHALLHVADVYRQQGDLERYAELVGGGGLPLAELDDSPAWQGTTRYNVACAEALLGRTDEALATLREALTLAPRLVEWSREDGDLASLRDLPAYEAIYESLE